MLYIEGLVYQYGPHVVLNQLACSLTAGQIGLLVGQNGAGKSTLLRCLAGWSEPTAGTITINGVPLDKADRAYRRQVIFVPDTPDFYDALSAWDHLQLTAQLYRLPDAWKDRAEYLLSAFQLEDRAAALPFTFSRGMRYKLALSMALLVDPPLLLLDEPFGPLDAPAVDRLWQLLQQHRSAGRGVLVSSHTLPERQRPDLILHLHEGQIETLQPEAVSDLAQLLDGAGDESTDHAD